MASEPRLESYLREARMRMGISQERLSRQANVSKETIRNIEKGTSIPNVLLALALAEIVGVTVHDLFKKRG